VRFPMVIEATMFWQVNKKNSLRALYLNISDEDLVTAIDMMKFDTGRQICV
jgi:hypothetical protein